MISSTAFCQSPSIASQFESSQDLELNPRNNIDIIIFLTKYFDREAITSQYHQNVTINLDENESLVSRWQILSPKTSCFFEKISNFLNAWFDQIFPDYSRPLFDLTCKSELYETTCEGSFKLLDGLQPEDYRYYYQSFSKNLMQGLDIEEKEPIYQTFVNRLEYEEITKKAKAESFHIETVSLRDDLLFSNQTTVKASSVSLASYSIENEQCAGHPKILKTALDFIIEGD